jgi:thiol-disulfide isomerase/thioredoxin
MLTIDNPNSLEHLIKSTDIVVMLMSDMSCNVCLAIYPELEAMSQRIPNVIFASSDVTTTKTLVGRYMIFLYPTIIVFVMGKETVRFERVFSLKDVESAINRYNRLLK